MSETLVLSARDIARVLDTRACVAAVEQAFALDPVRETIPSGVLGAHVESGGFHVKTAGLLGERPLFVAKVNANFPGNPERFGLPTIQGVLALFDATNGKLLALIDSGSLTSVRTAAATAVAAKHLAREDATAATICGCGEQGRSQLRALCVVRSLRTVFAYDADPSRAGRFASEMTRELGIGVIAAGDLASAVKRSEIVVTATPSRRWILGRADVSSGTFIAAVGADHPEKQEIEPALMVESVVVVDHLEQCERMGDLHHAISAMAMRREDVAADLAAIVSGRKRIPYDENAIVIFDSTGTALQDVAAARLAYTRALELNLGSEVTLDAH